MSLLDNANNTIFLHVDSKAADYECEHILREAGLKYAQIVELPRMDMVWASSREIDCILMAMQTALSFEWDYFHYITENDMPLKSQKQIDAFLEKHFGREFISYTPQWYGLAQYKCQVYHLCIDNPAYRKCKLLHYVNHGLARLQYVFGVRRSKRRFYHGSGYFSVTRDFVEYVLAQRDDIKKTYRKTLCGLEVFMQTVCYYSSFRKRLYRPQSKYDGNLRYIDWERRDGNSPYTFTVDDWDDIQEKMDNTDLFFIRKVTDPELVDLIYRRVKISILDGEMRGE